MRKQQQPMPKVGEIWRDRDERSKGSGEFEVLEVGDWHAVVLRTATQRRTRIRLSRMTAGEYIRIGAGR